MLYLLKLGASFILPPGIFIVALTMVAVYLWRWRKERQTATLLMIITVAFYLLCTGWVSDKLLGSLEQMYPVPAEPKGDVIIMLGGGAIAGVKDVDGEGMLASSPSSRLLTVFRLQRQLNLPVLLSGGQVFSDTGAEAIIAQRILISLGMPEDKIIVEPNSLTTTQNALFSAKLLADRGLNRPILVTSAFHMPRAVLNFERLGIKVTPYPADYWVSAKPEFYYMKLAPSAGALHSNVTFLRERLRTWVMLYLE